jgi:hypothetical protein
VPATADARTHFRQALTLYQSTGCTADASRVQATLDSLENTELIP